MSLRKLDMVCKKLDDESAASLRELYGKVVAREDLDFLDHFQKCTTKSGIETKAIVLAVPSKKGAATRVLVGLDYDN